MVTESSFYGLEPLWWRADRLFKVFAVSDAICGAWVAGQFYDEQAFRTQAGPAGMVGMVFYPLAKRWARKRHEKEAVYQTVVPGSPQFLGVDRRNFLILRQNVERVVITCWKSAWTPTNSGEIEIFLTGRGQRRRLILIGEQDVEQVERMLSRSLGRVAVVGASTTVGKHSAAKDCPKCGLVNPEEASRCDCGYRFSGQETLRSAAQSKQQRGASALARWHKCLALGVVLTAIALIVFPVSYWISRPVALEKLRTEQGEIDRVEIVNLPKGGRYVKVRLVGSKADLSVREVNFLESGTERLLALQPGEQVTVWLAPNGWAPGDRNNVWQLYRREQPIGRGLRAELAVLEYREMARAVAASGARFRLFLGWGLLCISISLTVVGAVGAWLGRRRLLQGYL